MSEQLLATMLLGNSVVPSTVTYSMSVPTYSTCMSARSHIVQWTQQIMQLDRQDGNLYTVPSVEH